MDHYIVSARKYRPSTFASVVGQPALTATLKNAIATDRLAHAYLFCGSRGVGKTSCARIFAKTINCEHPTADGEACNECPSCQAFNENRSLNIVELDAASHNSIDDIRNMIEQVQLPPTQGRYRVFIIDEVHMLSTAAFNAFLKTLEEPPSYVIFILATTEKHKIIPTILSRCQIYDFNRITIRDMVGHLAYVASKEGITADPAALAVIASKADGAMRDALSIFDQVAASSRGTITYQSAIDNLNVLDNAYYKRLFEAFLSGNVPTVLTIYKEIRDKGFDSQFFVNGLALYIRDLMLASSPQTLKLLEIPDEMRSELAQMAGQCKPEFLYKAMDLCNAADLNYRQASNKQFLVELLLIKLCQADGPSHGIDDEGEGRLEPIVVTTTIQPISSSATQQSTLKQTSAAPQQPRTHSTVTSPSDAVKTEPSPMTTNQTTVNIAGITRPKLRTPELTLHNKQTTQAEEASETVTVHERREARYTHDDVTQHWQAYMDDHSKSRLLVNVMRNSRPTHESADKFVIYVENEVQSNLVSENLSNIEVYLRDKLDNDNITLTVAIKDGLSSPKTWTEREVLDHMKRTNPIFNDFVDDFKLTLL